MIESQYNRRIELFDNAEDYVSAIRGRRARMATFAIVAVILQFAIMAVLHVFAPNAAPYSAIIAVGMFLIVMIPIWIWNQPRFGMYLLAAAACLFIQMPPVELRDPFTIVPFFWNVSTTWEHWVHGSKALGFIHLNYGEVVMFCTALFWLMRQILVRSAKINFGPFFFWFALYLLWACFGFVRGVQKGGDITVALWELRAQAYLALAYLMAVNLITDRKHAFNLLLIMAVCIGMKSIVGSVLYLMNPHVDPDVGVLSHEDSLLLNIIFFGALLFSLANVENKLKWVFVAFVPTALAASMANGRRAGIAAFIVAMPAVIAMSAVLLRARRNQLIAFLACLTVVTAIYLPLAWNSEGAWALPARAIRSQSSPDPRDASSDAYRIAENYNLKATRDSSPFFGYGYGRPYLHIMNQPGRHDVFAYVLPHNGILWIWMRLGHPGFVLFWMFVASVLVGGPMMLKSIRDPRLQILGIMAVATLLMLIIYGQYDLSFANYRTMWLTGTMLGIMGALPKLVELKRTERQEAGAKLGGGQGDDLDVREVGDNEDDRPPLPWETGPAW